MSRRIDPPRRPKNVPPVIGDYFDALTVYLKSIRIADVFGGFLSDAPGGGKRIIVNPSNGSGGILPNPFRVYVAESLTGEDPSRTPFRVIESSTLLQSVACDDTVEISNLTERFFFENFDAQPNQKAWLEIYIPATDDDDYTAAFNNGVDWNSAGFGTAVYPNPVAWDTDDGSATGSTGTPPDNKKPVTIFVPLAETYESTPDSDSDLTGTTRLTDKIVLKQLTTSNLLIQKFCVDGDQVPLAMPWHGGFYKAPTP